MRRLPPERIGGRNGYRITPVASGGRVTAARLQEALGISAQGIAQPLLDTMVRLMRRDMRSGNRIAYDQPEQMHDLYVRACTIGNQRPALGGDSVPEL